MVNLGSYLASILFNGFGILGGFRSEYEGDEPCFCLWGMLADEKGGDRTAFLQLRLFKSSAK